MKVGTQAVLGTAVAMGALATTIVLATRLLVVDQLNALEHDSIEARAAQTGPLFDVAGENLIAKIRDWAWWDDVERFVAGDNPGFREENITADTLVQIGWHQLAILDADGRILLGADLPRDGGAPLSPAMAAAVTSREVTGDIRASQEPFHGIVTVEGRPFLFASASVKHTDQTQGTPGRFIVFTAIDDRFAEGLSRNTLQETHVATPDTATGAAKRGYAEAMAHPTHAAAIPTSDSEMSAVAVLSDVRGQPAVVVDAPIKRTIPATAAQIVTTTTWVVIGAGVVIAALVMLGVRLVLLRPLDAIVTGVRRVERGEPAAIGATTDDELGELSRAVDRMGRVIRDREAALAAAHADIAAAMARVRTILDNTGNALFVVDRDGRVDPEVSAAAVQWFGAPDGRPVWAWVFADGDPKAAMLEIGFDALRDDFMPVEVVLAQMATRFRRADRDLDLQLKPVGDGRVLVIVADVTAELLAEARERDTREFIAAVTQATRDPAAYRDFVLDTERILAIVERGERGPELARALHTLKGNAGILGLTALASACHALEDTLADDADPQPGAAALRAHFQGLRARVAEAVAEDDGETLRLRRHEHEALLRAVEGGLPHGDLVRLVRGLALDPVRAPLERLGRGAERVATKLDKPARVYVEDHGVRVDGARFAPLWGALVHAVRNAVDHGIEPRDVRVAAHKDPYATVRLSARLVGGALEIALDDDGGGVDWDRIREKAAARGLPHATDADLRQALFEGGVSARDTVTDLSGRGVGMSAVYAATTGLGGTLDLQSRRGVGTSLRCRIPVDDAAAAIVAAPARAAA